MKLGRRKVTEDKKCSIMEGGIRVDELLSRTVHSKEAMWEWEGTKKEMEQCLEMLQMKPNAMYAGYFLKYLLNSPRYLLEEVKLA